MIAKILFLFSILVPIHLLPLSVCLSPGVYYEHKKQKSPYPLSIHILTVDPEKASIVLAPSSAYGTGETTSTLAKRYNALAAVNGSFFSFGSQTSWQYIWTKLGEIFGIYQYAAFPLFCVKVKDMWFSLSPGIAPLLGWKNGGQVAFIDRIKLLWKIRIGDKIYPIHGLNKMPESLPILYTSAFGSHTPYRKDIIEVVIEENRVKEVKKGQGGTPIPKNGSIYVVKNSFPHLLSIQPATSITFIRKFISSVSYAWQDMDYLLGSFPILIKDGTINSFLYKSTNISYIQRHPRTAVGLLSNGHWLFLVVDGRQHTSEGASLLELAQYMKEQGCTSALNLDGGESSTLVIKNEVVNSPSGTTYSLFTGKYVEYPVANALLILAAC